MLGNGTGKGRRAQSSWFFKWHYGGTLHLESIYSILFLTSIKKNNSASSLSPGLELERLAILVSGTEGGVGIVLVCHRVDFYVWSLISKPWIEGCCLFGHPAQRFTKLDYADLTKFSYSKAIKTHSSSSVRNLALGTHLTCAPVSIIQQYKRRRTCA